MAAVVAAFPCGIPASSQRPTDFLRRGRGGGRGIISWCLGRVSTLDNRSPPPFNVLPDFTHKYIFVYSDKLFVSKSSSALTLSFQLQD